MDDVAVPAKPNGGGHSTNSRADNSNSQGTGRAVSAGILA